MNKRTQSLLPGGVPKYVRVYDDGKSGDRYTVVFTGRYRHKTGGEFWYLGMSGTPTHPQGIGQHGSNRNQIDVNKSGFAPAIGRKNHLGKRIAWTELPTECQGVALRTYKELWDLA